ncbi:MAG: hypothetical protein MUC94_01490 [bacterium]|nr:hypothetical protein [bacterium]
MLNDKQHGKSIAGFISKIDPYVLNIILLSLYIPLIGIHLYFRYDDAGTLLWAIDFKKSIFLAFDPRPWFDEYNFYNGVGGYYRPFESLFIMLLVKIFGPEPFYFQLINGILVITTIVFVYKITVLLTQNRLAGLLTGLMFHLSFQSLLYGMYHVVVPFGFFFEIITFYFFLKGLYSNNLKMILIGFLFLIPATNRQTTALILTAMVIMFFVTHWRESKFRTGQRILIFFLAVIPNAIIPFTKNSSHATILSQPFSIVSYANYAWERLFFYSNLMTSRLPGIIILTIISFYMIFQVMHRQKIFKLHDKYQIYLAIPCSLIFSFMMMKVQILGIITLYAVLIFLFLTRRNLQLIITWFFVSLGLFSIIKFYHDAYFLEAAFAIAIILGCILSQLIDAMQRTFEVHIQPRLERLLLAWLAGTIVLLGVVIWKVPGLPVIGSKVEAVQYLIETNQNFKAMIEYLAEELPPEAKVFQLSEEYLGLTMDKRRFLTLRERSENVKVINILDSNVMIKALGRWDIEFKHAEGLTLGIPENSVFIVHNRLEKRIAERKFNLHPIRHFQNQNTEAVVYNILSIKEDLYPKE